MKGNTVQRDGKRKKQSIVKVPPELVKLHQDVELAIDCFSVNKHVFFTTFSTKVCFTTVTHLTSRTKEVIWAALLATYKMYLLRGFRIVVIRRDQEFAYISDLAVALPTKPNLDWAAASQHCGLVERNIRFLKEKTRSLRHSLPFERVPAIMVVRMVLHIVKFVNGFPWKGGVKHFSPGQILTGQRLHADGLCLGFGIYCQVAENVEPRNSLAPRTRGAISLGSSGNLSGGQVFLALDTGHTIIQHQWVVLPMPPAVIARVNLLGKAEPSILTFTDWHGREIGEYAKTLATVADEDDTTVDDFIQDVIPQDGSTSQEWMWCLQPILSANQLPNRVPSPQEWRWRTPPKHHLKMDLVKRPQTSKKSRAVQPARQPRRYLKTLLLLVKEWQLGMQGLGSFLRSMFQA
jgi:hypothetical protein